MADGRDLLVALGFMFAFTIATVLVLVFLCRSVGLTLGKSTYIQEPKGFVRFLLLKMIQAKGHITEAQCNYYTSSDLISLELGSSAMKALRVRQKFVVGFCFLIMAKRAIAAPIAISQVVNNM